MTDKKIFISKEQFVEIAKSLTPEERKYLVDRMVNKSCLNCTNEECRVEYSEKIGYDEYGKPQGSRCVGWKNYELIGKSKVLMKRKINK